MRIYRVVGDHGAKARITLTDVKDAEGTLVTAGTLTLRAQGLFEGTMTHDAEGTWHYDPAVGDLSAKGTYRLEAKSEDGQQVVTIPSETPWTLHVRDAVAGP